MTINHKNVVIIDYQMGNVASVKKAFEKIGAKIKISHFEKDIKNAEYLILPGVGAFEEGMKNLTKQGLINLLQKQVVEKGVPLLGKILHPFFKCANAWQNEILSIFNIFFE